MEPTKKKLRLHGHESDHGETENSTVPESLNRPISPPPLTKQRKAAVLPSPFRLTYIRDLPPELNRDAVTLNDLLGDPLIKECWNFNYLHDIEFLMAAFDEDTRHLVDVHIVHGFWKREDTHREGLIVSSTAFATHGGHEGDQTAACQPPNHHMKPQDLVYTYNTE
jgi:tyrosyl-DNA phosphodiesterase 1